MPEPITIKGIEKITEEERSIINKLINSRFEKIQRQVKNETSIKVVVKTHEVESNRKKYGIEITAQIANNHFKSSESDWKLSEALNKALDKIQTEIEHKLHVSEQH